MRIANISTGNGGPTWTVAISAASKAVNTAECTDRDVWPVTVDQRGVTRPSEGQCDRGAFEYVDPLQPVQFLPLVVGS